MQARVWHASAAGDARSAPADAYTDVGGSESATDGSMTAPTSRAARSGQRQSRERAEPTPPRKEDRLSDSAVAPPGLAVHRRLLQPAPPLPDPHAQMLSPPPKSAVFTASPNDVAELASAAFDSAYVPSR